MASLLFPKIFYTYVLSFTCKNSWWPAVDKVRQHSSQQIFFSSGWQYCATSSRRFHCINYSTSVPRILVECWGYYRNFRLWMHFNCSRMGCDCCSVRWRVSDVMQNINKSFHWFNYKQLHWVVFLTLNQLECKVAKVQSNGSQTLISLKILMTFQKVWTAWIFVFCRIAHLFGLH